MKLIEDEKLDPKKTAFLLPTANGPCRFGQYVGLLRRVLDEQGYEDVAILSFTSADGYAGIGRAGRGAHPYRLAGGGQCRTSC